jgi:hypothetical protein
MGLGQFALGFFERGEGEAHAKYGFEHFVEFVVLDRGAGAAGPSLHDFVDLLLFEGHFQFLQEGSHLIALPELLAVGLGFEEVFEGVVAFHCFRDDVLDELFGVEQALDEFEVTQGGVGGVVGAHEEQFVKGQFHP